MVFLKTTRSFVDRFRNYHSFKLFLKMFLNSQKKKKSMVITLKILMISDKSNDRFTVK